MPAFLFRCPNTNLNVQGWIAHEPGDRDDDIYEAVTCLACRAVHLVDPKTGKLIGGDDK